MAPFTDIAFNDQSAALNTQENCKENELFSKEFGKCLPKPGTDGFIGNKDSASKSIDESQQIAKALREEPRITTYVDPLSDRVQAISEMPERVMGKHEPLRSGGIESAAQVHPGMPPIRRLAIQMAW